MMTRRQICLLPAVFGAQACQAKRSGNGGGTLENSIRGLVQHSIDGHAIAEFGLPAAKPSSEELRQSAEYITAHPDHTAYHLLMLLRNHAPEQYASLDAKTRAQVLCAALGHSRYLNDWGYLDLSESYDGEAAKALLETAAAAVPFLSPLLADKRPAPLFGSEEATLSSMYQYRRCDFAYRYQALIKGMEPRFEKRPSDRDKAIAALKNQLAKEI